MMQLLHLHTPTSIPALQEFVNSNSPPIPPLLASCQSDLEFCTHIALFQTAGLLHIEHVTNNAAILLIILALAYLGKMHLTKIQGLVKN